MFSEGSERITCSYVRVESARELLSEMSVPSQEDRARMMIEELNLRAQTPLHLVLPIGYEESSVQLKLLLLEKVQELRLIPRIFNTEEEEGSPLNGLHQVLPAAGALLTRATLQSDCNVQETRQEHHSEVAPAALQPTQLPRTTAEA